MDNKERIITEAASLYRTYGIRAVTMDMLAGQMGISKRTIYELFRDKEELLHAVLRWMGERQRELTMKSLESSENVIAAIFMIMENMLEHYRKMSPAFRLDMKKYHNDIVQTLRENDELPYSNSREIIIRGIREGVFREDIDIEITNRCISGVSRITEGEERVADDSFDEEIIRNFLINYLRGISTPKGLELIRINENKRMGNRGNLQI